MHQLSRRAFGLAVAGSTLATAQDQDTGLTFRSDTREVLLHATVVDRKGAFVTDLGRDAFKVLEDGVEQNLRVFRREDVPVSMGLIVDNSGSMRRKRKKVEDSAMALVKASNRQDEIFIVNFNDVAYRDADLTGDMKKLEEGLSRIDSKGGTAMRDALTLSIDYIKEKGRKAKKVLLIITDGDDTASSDTNTLEKLLAKAQRSEVLIFAIGILNEEDRRMAKRAQRALELLTKQSGGIAHFPKDVESVEDVALQIAKEIRSQYILAYSPTKPDDGSYRQLKVTVKGGGLTVRTRTGYYAKGDEKRSSL
ncbi:MAG: VWA domain-containing protein [Acidobacteria bacterium]|nr:VWA domain-containing protein [Acidobacteriota bacterium]